jgi:hypothetical protein
MLTSVVNVSGPHVELTSQGMSKSAGAQVIQWTDGSVTSGCTASGPRQPGTIGNALSFCGSSAYVNLPTGVVSSLTGDYTVSAWIDPASNATWQRLFYIGTGSTASMFLTVNDGNELRYAITTSGAGGEQRLNSSTKTLPLNQWSLVTVTVAGTTGTLYVNGQVVATNTNMTIHPSAFGASTHNYIGKSQYGSDPALNATVDDFNIYDRALSAAEISALASGQVGAGDVVHYTFDEAGGSAVLDSSGNNRNATIINGTASTTTTATDAATADHFWTLTPELTPLWTLTGTAPPTNGWYNSTVLVSLATTTNDKIQYQVDGGAWKNYSTPFAVSGNGQHTVNDRLLASNVVVDGSNGSFPVNIDKTAPAVTVTKDPTTAKDSPRNPVTLTFGATDATSGVATISYNINGGDWTTVTAETPVTFDTEGSYVVGYQATDTAGNTSAIKTVTVHIAADPATSVKLSPTKIAAGGYDTITLAGYHRYTVIDLTIGTVSLGSVTTDVNGSAKVTVQIPPTTTPGTTTVTAAEDGGTLSSTATLTITP